MKTIKQIKGITLVQVTDGRLTIFNSELEKANYVNTHKDAVVHNNYGIEPLYMLIDTEGTGFCLTPKHAITYNEAIQMINMYY